MKSQSKPLRFSGTLEKSDNKLWGSHIVVPPAIVQKLISKTSRRVIRTLNGSAEHQCALLPFARCSYVLSVNKKLCTMLGLEIGAKVVVTLRKDESKYGLPVPAELEEYMRQDKEGHRLFHALTIGRQRTLLYMIGSSTDPDLRAWKAALIIRHLKENAGAINYRQLMTSFKRQRS
jgi:hypothetical protein